MPFALDVPALTADAYIAEVVSFINRTADSPNPSDFARWPELPADPARTAVFARTARPT